MSGKVVAQSVTVTEVVLRGRDGRVAFRLWVEATPERIDAELLPGLARPGERAERTGRTGEGELAIK